jgi:uncharacterized membrane protein
MDGALIFWLGVTIIIIVLSAIVVHKRKNYKTLFAAIIAIMIIPIIIVSQDCIQNSSSEACVWGQSFMPLYFGFSLFVGGPILFLLISFFTWVYKLFTSNNGGTNA